MAAGAGRASGSATAGVAAAIAAAFVFDVAASAVHRLDGREQNWRRSRLPSMQRSSSCERDVHLPDLGTDSQNPRRVAAGAQDHARPIDRDVMPFSEPLRLSR
jgi:hypothetical protein